MTDELRAPVGGGMPRSPKRRFGRKWLKGRNRPGLNWHNRKVLSKTYCKATK